MARKDEPQNTHILLCVVLKQRYKIPVERERERGREGKKARDLGLVPTLLIAGCTLPSGRTDWALEHVRRVHHYGDPLVSESAILLSSCYVSDESDQGVLSGSVKQNQVEMCSQLTGFIAFAKISVNVARCMGIYYYLFTRADNSVWLPTENGVHQAGRLPTHKTANCDTVQHRTVSVLWCQEHADTHEWYILPVIRYLSTPLSCCCF